MSSLRKEPLEIALVNDYNGMATPILKDSIFRTFRSVNLVVEDLDDFRSIPIGRRKGIFVLGVSKEFTEQIKANNGFDEKNQLLANWINDAKHAFQSFPIAQLAIYYPDSLQDEFIQKLQDWVDSDATRFLRVSSLKDFIEALE